MKRNRFFTAVLCVLLLLSACGAAPTEEAMDYYVVTESLAPAEQIEALGRVEELASADSAITGAAVSDSRKLIKTVDLDAETEHYDDLIPALEAQIVSLGGYIESRQSGSYARERRWCNMTVRIPAENLPDFVAHVSENANVTASSESTEDITLQYVDTEAKITALQTEQTRLLELLAQAQNITEILEIEARLSDVTYELERYTSQKRSYDNLVSYSTVNLSIQEVQVLTPTEEPSVWQRISTGFGGTLEDLGEGLTDLFVWTVVNSPYLAILAAVLVLIVLGLRRSSKKTKKYRDQPPTPPPAA